MCTYLWTILYKESLSFKDCKCIPIWKVKLATVVECEPKAPFSIVITPRCRWGRYSFPGLLHFTLDPYLIMLSVEQGGIKYHFLSVWHDSTWDWTPDSRTIGEHSTPLVNGLYVSYSKEAIDHRIPFIIQTKYCI